MDHRAAPLSPISISDQTLKIYPIIKSRRKWLLLVSICSDFKVSPRWNCIKYRMSWRAKTHGGYLIKCQLLYCMPSILQSSHNMSCCWCLNNHWIILLGFLFSSPPILNHLRALGFIQELYHVLLTMRTFKLCTSKNKDQLCQHLQAPAGAPSSPLSAESLPGLSNLPANQLITPTIGN